MEEADEPTASQNHLSRDPGKAFVAEEDELRREAGVLYFIFRMRTSIPFSAASSATSLPVSVSPKW